MSGRRPVRLTQWDRDVLISFFANPDFTAKQLDAALSLVPGELKRLLRLQEGRELMNSLFADFAPPDFWPEYRLPKSEAGPAFEPKRFMSRFTSPCSDPSEEEE